MNHLNPNKLALSKWTAVQPLLKEKHFLVTRLLHDEQGIVSGCVMEALISHREQSIDWLQLKDSAHWLSGWR